LLCPRSAAADQKTRSKIEFLWARDERRPETAQVTRKLRRALYSQNIRVHAMRFDVQIHGPVLHIQKIATVIRNALKPRFSDIRCQTMR
jgi:hypothetical protein